MNDCYWPKACGYTHILTFMTRCGDVWPACTKKMTFTVFSLLFCYILSIMLLPMYRLIGATGIGPKYLADEYAVLDSRYWPTKDPGVMIISFLELLVMGPLCICW